MNIQNNILQTEQKHTIEQTIIDQPNLIENKDTNNLETLFSSINLCDYVVKSKSNKHKDISSLSSLVKKILSQSDCIKLGTGVERVILNICSKNINFINIKQKNSKGKKEKDHLFINNETKEIYYAEFKSNINLDTEKSKSTYEKILFIIDELKHTYPDYKINGYLVAARYYDTNIIPLLLLNKYIPIKNNVIGINNYLTLFEQDNFNNEEHYSEWINTIANKMFIDETI
jgi:hypothetical protein